jgi:primosomal protein N' (replication factor Y)
MPAGSIWPFPRGIGYTPRTARFVRLTAQCRNEGRLSQVFDDLRRAPKQETLLLRYLDVSHAHNPVAAQEISRKELLEITNAQPSLIDALVKRGVL